MVSRRNTLIGLIVAAVFSPLSAVLAQSTVSSGSVDTATTTITQESSSIPTITASPTVSESATTSPSPTGDGLAYYPSTPGQSYDNPNQLVDETASAESNAGADGTSDTFIKIPLGAQIAIISVVVIVGISGLTASYLWYMRRRKQWELQGRRRSLVPRFSVNARGELRMSRPIITRKPNVPPTPSAMRPSSTNSLSTFLPGDLEKGNQRSDFETDPKAGGTSWKKIFSKK